MRVYISEVGEDGKVTLHAGGGEARVSWKGVSKPRPGRTEVELEISGPVRWGMQVSVTAQEEPIGIRPDGSLVAAVERWDPDGVLGLRLAENGLLLVAPEGSPPEIAAGTHLLIQGVEIAAYPENL